MFPFKLLSTTPPDIQPPNDIGHHGPVGHPFKSGGGIRQLVFGGTPNSAIRLPIRAVVPGSPNPGIPPVTGPTGPGGNAPPGVQPPAPPTPIMGPNAGPKLPRLPQARTPGGQFTDVRIPPPSIMPPVNPVTTPGAGPPDALPPSAAAPPAPAYTPRPQIQTGYQYPRAQPVVPSTSLPQSPQFVPPSTMPGAPAPLSVPQAIERVLITSTKSGIVPLITTAPTDDKIVGGVQFVGNFGLGQVRTPGKAGFIYGLVANTIFVFRQIAHAWDKETQLEASYNIPNPDVLAIIARAEARDVARAKRLTFSSTPSDGI